MAQRVAIVGAGMSGLSAARALTHTGCATRVFDKGRGVSGRMSTRYADPFAFDHGAQYFTARDARFVRAVDEWCALGVAGPWEGRIVSFDNGEWLATSPRKRYVGTPGMNAVCKHLAEGLDVVTNTRVAPVSRDGAAWPLRSEGGDDLGQYDALVVATPAFQAAELLRGVSHLASTASSIAMSPCWAVMLGFEQPLDIPFDGAFVNGGPLSWVARNASKPGRDTRETWMLHGSPTWSTEHLESAPEDVIAALLSAFTELPDVGPAAPTHTTAHRWRYAMPTEPLEVGALWDADQRVAICGDWCMGARVEGAFLSGLAAAEVVTANA